MADENILPRDQNHVTTAGFENSLVSGDVRPGQIIVATGRIKVDGSGGGSGTVTSVSVVTANGFAGTVATATTTPAITLTTTVTGILKGNGTAISAATAGTDYTALAFKTYVVAGQSDIVADSAADTFTFVAGTGITLTTNATTDTLTITASGSGGTPGTPVNSIQYNNASAFAGSATLLFNGTDTITFGAEDSFAQLVAPDGTTSNTNGGSFLFSAGAGNGAADGGDFDLAAGPSGLTSGAGGDMKMYAGLGQGTNSKGGDVHIRAGNKTGSGVAGKFIFEPLSATVSNGVLNFDAMSGGDKTFTFPNTSGTVALTTGGALALTVGTTTITSGTTTRILYDNAGVLGEYTLTGTGTVVVMATSPTLVTPVLGVAAATSINKVAITAPATSATLTIADGKTATHNASTTFAGTDGKTLTISNSGTLAGGDAFVLAIAAGKTLTVSNSLTFTGTDATSFAFPSGSDTVVTLAATQTLTNKTLTSPTIQTSPVLAAATNLKFTVPSSDPSATGITTNEFNSGYSSTAIGDLVYLDSSATWQKADADASAATYSSMLGIALSVAASAAPVNVLLQGFIYAATPFPTFTIGAPVFMSATAGAVTQTAPVTTDSATRIIGYGVHADKMYFKPSNDWITHT